MNTSASYIVCGRKADGTNVSSKDMLDYVNWASKGVQTSIPTIKKESITVLDIQGLARGSEGWGQLTQPSYVWGPDGIYYKAI